MTVMTSLHVPPDGWTVDELPDRDTLRYELVDGALLVSPPPRPRHSGVAAALHLLLAGAATAEWVVLESPGVNVDRRNYREPDVAVVRRAALDRDALVPSDVVLAVEVMSPGSVANDRLAKPALYASAGIPHFWRVELEPLLLVAHELEGQVYREVARFTEEVITSSPVRLRFRLDDLFR